VESWREFWRGKARWIEREWKKSATRNNIGEKDKNLKQITEIGNGIEENVKPRTEGKNSGVKQKHGDENKRRKLTVETLLEEYPDVFDVNDN
jgi:hypothetical protein